VNDIDYLVNNSAILNGHTFLLSEKQDEHSFAEKIVNEVNISNK